MIIMAGGLGKRLGQGEEKPLRLLGGKRLIDYVLDAAYNARSIEEIICITSPNTPKTTQYLSSRKCNVILGKGEGYYADLLSILWSLSSNLYVVCSADIPFITSRDIDELVKMHDYGHIRSSYVFVAVPIETVKKLGLSASSNFKINDKELCPAGIRLIDTRRLKARKLPSPYVLIKNEPRLAVNINTIEDLKVAEELIKKNRNKLFGVT